MAEEVNKGVDSKTFQMLIEEQKKTTSGMTSIRKKLFEEQKNTTTAIRHQSMTAEEIAEEQAKKQEEFEKKQEAGIKGNQTRLDNLAQKTPTAAEVEETTAETNSYLKSTFSKFLGKSSFLAGTLGGIGKSLKQKVTGGIEGIFKALKAGAFVAFLLGMAKFLESETFQDIKDKYLPAITKGLDKLGKALKNIADGFFTVETDEFGKETYKFDFLAGVKNIFSMIGNAFIAFKDDLLSSFLDENGDLTIKSFLTGIPTAFGKIGVALGAVSGLLFLLSPRLFFGATSYVGGKLFGALLGKKGLIAGGFKLLFGSMSGMNTSLTDTGTAMDGKLASSKKTGVFRKGLRGLTGRFGKLFSFFGKRKGLAGLIIGAGVGMSALLTSNSGPDSIFAKIGTGFSNLFTKVGAFGAKIGTAVSGMTTKLATSLSDGVFSIAKGVGTKFGTLFGKVGEFGTKIGTTVSGMATSLTNTTVFKTISSGFSSLFGVLSDFGSTIAKTAAKATAKVTKVAADAAASIAKIGSKVAKPATKLSKTALDALRGTGEFAFKPKAKVLSGGGRGTAVEQAGDRAKYLKGLSPNKSAAKLGTELSEAALKKSLLKTGFGVAGKAIPLVGAFLGLGLSAWRALKGDFVGATGEFAGIFAPSLVGLPLDLGLAARDIYYDQFGVYPEQEKDLKLAKSRMGQITAFLKKQKPKAEVKPADNPFSGKVKPMDFKSSSGNDRSPNLVPNMAYDYNEDGTLSRGERINASRRGLTDGPLMIAPVTNINNTSNSNTSVMNRTLVMQDPLLRSAINAM